MNDYTGWSIYTGFLTGNLFSGWSSDELAEIDVPASIERYNTSLPPTCWASPASVAPTAPRALSRKEADRDSTRGGMGAGPAAGR